MKKILKITPLLLFLLLFSSCVGFYVIPTRQYNLATSDAPYDVAIVPGIPYNDSWDNIMKLRVLWSVYLYKNGVVKHIIYSGGAVYTPYYESKIMKEYAISLGVDSNHITIETEANHGVENLLNSVKLGYAMGCETFVLATDPAQSLQVGYFGKPLANRVTFIPVVLSRLDFDEANNITINSEKAYKVNFIPYIDKISTWERFKRSSGRSGTKSEMRRFLNQMRKST